MRLCILGTTIGIWLTCVLAAGQDPVILWNNTALEAIRKDQTQTLKAARNLAMMHAAIYDAVMASEGTHSPYRSRPEVPLEANAEAAVTAAAHRVLTSLYPKQVHSFDELLLKQYALIPESKRKKMVSN